MYRLGIVVGAAPIGMEREYLTDLCKEDDTYVVAADGGIEFFQSAGIKPNEWVGDMDSVSEKTINEVKIITNEQVDKDRGRAEGNEVVKITCVSAVKDYTDMELGLEKVFETGCESAMIFGGTGGKRIEHTIANIQLIHKYVLMGTRVIIVSENHRIFVIHN